MPPALRVLALLLLAPLAAASPLVALDAGHFPEKPGTHGASGREERLFNLDFVAALDAQLQALGLATRLVPQDASLVRRAATALGAQLLVSVHHDSMKEEYLPLADHFAGYSLYVSPRQPRARYARALACARSISQALRATGRPFTTHHTGNVAGENRPWIDPSLGIYRYDDLIILHRSPVPALLLEVGVIPNPSEERLAADPVWVQAQAAAVAAGIARCLAAR